MSIRGTAVVAVGMVASQILSLAQMLVVSRLLGPVEFGVFGSLSVVLLLGSTAMVATQVVIARHVALGGSASAIGRRPIIAVAAGTCAVALLLTPLLAVVLNLPNWLGLIWVSLTLVPLTITGSQLGHLQGRERFSRLGLLYLISTGVRVFGGILGAQLVGSAEATSLGIMLGASLAALLGMPLARHTHTRSRGPGARAVAIEIGHAGHALLALYALTNVDMLLARSQLASHDAGLYAAGQMVARAVFFLPSAILVAAFPRMVSQPGNRAQRQTTIAVTALGLLATAATAVLPGLVLAIMAGPEYVAIADYLWLFALAGAGFAVVQVLLYARLAQHDRRAAILMWTGVAVLIVLGVTIGGRGVAQLAACAACVAWLVAGTGLLFARRPIPFETPAAAPEPAV